MADPMKALETLKAEKEWIRNSVSEAHNKQSLEWSALYKNIDNIQAQSKLMALGDRRDALLASKEQAKGTGRAYAIRDEIISINKQMRSMRSGFSPEARRFISLSSSVAHLQNKIDGLNEDIKVLDEAITKKNPKIARNIGHDIGDSLVLAIWSKKNTQSLFKSVLTEMKALHAKKGKLNDDDPQESNRFLKK